MNPALLTTGAHVGSNPPTTQKKKKKGKKGSNHHPIYLINRRQVFAIQSECKLIRQFSPFRWVPNPRTVTITGGPCFYGPLGCIISWAPLGVLTRGAYLIVSTSARQREFLQINTPK